MRHLTTTLVVLVSLGCNSQQGESISASNNFGNQKIAVRHIVEIVRLKDPMYNPGIAIRTRIKNNTGRNVFFYVPQTQVWYDDNGRKTLYTEEIPARTPGVIPEDYQPWHDTIDNPAFDLANEMIKKRPELRDHNDVQRFIFAANVTFLKDQEEKEIIDEITLIQQNLPGQCKIVTSYLRPARDRDKILDAPPAQYNGYEFWNEPIVSDTTLLNIR